MPWLLWPRNIDMMLLTLIWRLLALPNQTLRVRIRMTTTWSAQPLPKDFITAKDWSCQSTSDVENAEWHHHSPKWITALYQCSYCSLSALWKPPLKKVGININPFTYIYPKHSLSHNIFALLSTQLLSSTKVPMFNMLRLSIVVCLSLMLSALGYDIPKKVSLWGPPT